MSNGGPGECLYHINASMGPAVLEVHRRVSSFGKRNPNWSLCLLGCDDFWSVFRDDERVLILSAE